MTICRTCDEDSPATVTLERHQRGYNGGTGPALKADELTSALKRVQGAAKYAAESRRNSRHGVAPLPAMAEGEQDMFAYKQETYRRRRTGASNKRTNRSSRSRKVF